MRKTTFTAIIATGFFLAPGTALADEAPEVPEEGTECNATDDPFELEGDLVLECERNDEFEWLWTVVETEGTGNEDDEDDTVPATPLEPPVTNPSPDDEDDTDEGEGSDDDTDTGSDDEDEDTHPGKGGEGEGGEGETPADKSTEGAEKPVEVETVSSDTDTLPVTGGALTGLVAAAVAALGGGVAALHFGRKRRS